MENASSYKRIKLLNNNPKNLHHSSSMNSMSVNRYSKSNSKSEKNFIKSRKKRNKLLSTSSLGLIKNQKYNQNNEYNLISNNDRQKNIDSNFSKYNQFLSLNSYKKNTDVSSSQNQNILPDIYLNKNKNINSESNNTSNRKPHRNKSQQEFNRETTTFYSLSKNPNSNFILDKRIKILIEPKTNTYNSNLLDGNNNEMNLNEYYYNTTNKKIFYNKLLPSDLRNFKKKLFDESSKRILSNSKNQDYITPVDSGKNIKNLNIDSNTINKKNKKENSKKNIDEEKNFENIEFNGILTKVITKLPTNRDIKEKNDVDDDYHKIMKHPFIQESYGYDFLRNLKNEYKIYENPFEDKDLIYNIHNLIINPNTKKFRNDNLIIGADYYKRRNKSELSKDYKTLSKLGYKKMQNSIMHQLKKDVEKNILNMKRIKCDLDILMKKNIKKFKEHREELIYEEL